MKKSQYLISAVLIGCAMAYSTGSFANANPNKKHPKIAIQPGQSWTVPVGNNTVKVVVPSNYFPQLQEKSADGSSEIILSVPLEAYGPNGGGALAAVDAPTLAATAAILTNDLGRKGLRGTVTCISSTGTTPIICSIHIPKTP